MNRFAEFNRFTNSPVANYHGELYSLPFNMYTFNKMWGVVTPQEAAEKIEEQKKAAGITEPENLEEQAISLVGTDIYEKLVKGYTCLLYTSTGACDPCDAFLGRGAVPGRASEGSGDGKEQEAKGAASEYSRLFRA